MDLVLFRSFLNGEDIQSMLTNFSQDYFDVQKRASLFLVVLCHIIFLAFFMHSARREKPVPSHALMVFFSVKKSAEKTLKVSDEKVEVKVVAHFVGTKNSRIETTKFESRNTNDAINSEQFSVEKAKGEGNTISSKELASLDSLGRRYNVEMPEVSSEEPLTPAQQAAQDPRTNSARLTKSEKFAVALGTLDCIFQTRLADGKIIRVPGHWAEMPARSEPGRESPFRTVRFCVRAQQAEGGGSDLTAITAGLKGK
jgi:hypothetical protein